VNYIFDSKINSYIHVYKAHICPLMKARMAKCAAGQKTKMAENTGGAG